MIGKKYRRVSVPCGTNGGIRLTSAGLICCLAVPHLLMVVVIVIIGLNCISKVFPRRNHLLGIRSGYADFISIRFTT